MFLKIRSNNSKRKNMQLFSDEELIISYKNLRDTIYIGELFERYTHLVFGVCLKYLKDRNNGVRLIDKVPRKGAEESKDAVMQIFENLQQKLIDFEISSFKSWIYTVSRNHCLMILRKNKTERKHQVEIFERSREEIMETADFFHPIKSDDKEEQMTFLQKGIEKLKKEQRTCIELLYLQQKSYQEVSEITGYDIKKVKSYIQNGKRNLRLFLENK